MATCMSNTTHEPPLIKGLLSPAAYAHAAPQPELAETHISWVLLAGAFAYKVKKPVDFGFLDFSTLERRRACCAEEVRLNRRYAPDLYLAVAPIVGTPEQPQVDQPGLPIEYAVKMRRFDEAGLFSRLADTRRLSANHMDALAGTLAAFHAASARAVPDSPFGHPSQQRQAAESNFAKLRPLLYAPEDLASLDALETWTQAEYARRESLMDARLREGWVRECHGDLHLGNIVLIEGRPTPFDGIEFNPALRWIDTASELAFVVMDLEARGERGLAYRLLNRYLEITGDYGGLALLGYYRLYRALVRAKIAMLTRAQHDEEADKKAALLAECRRYLDYGQALIQPQQPGLLITHGLSGSGKSHLSLRLASALPAIRLRSDIERKRLAGLTATAPSGAGRAGNLYSAESTAKTYRHLADAARNLLRWGYSAIIDATFLKRAHRQALRRVAKECGTGFALVDCQAPQEILEARLRERALAGTDPSEADLSVLARQIAEQEPLDAEDAAQAVAADSARSWTDEEWAARIRAAWQARG